MRWSSLTDPSLSRKLYLAKVVLAELNKSPLTRTMLEKQTIMHCGTRHTFENIFNFLLQQGYVEKTEARLRAPYRITEKGKRFLEGLEWAI